MKKSLTFLFATIFFYSSNLLLAQQNLLSNLRLVLPVGHSKPIYSATYSTDGKIIATAGGDNKILIWDASTGKLLKNLEGHSRPISSLKFSPNGLTILSYSEDKNAIIWDLLSGKMLYVLKDHFIGIGSSNFSPDGNLIVTGGGYDGNIGEDTTAKIWNTKSGVLLHTLEGHHKSLNDVVFSPDGKMVLTSSLDHSARIWDVKSGRLLHELYGHTESVNFANFSADGKLILTSSDDYSARIWDAISGKCLNILKSEGVIKYAAFSPDGKLIVTSSWEKNSAQIWNTSTGNLIKTIKGRMLIYNPNEKINGIYPFSIWDCLTGNLIDVQSGEILKKIEITNNDIEINSNVLISPNGKKILVTGSLYIQMDKNGSLWNYANVFSFESGNSLYTLKGNLNLINLSYLSKDEKKIITIAAPHDIYNNCTECGSEIGIWELKTGGMLKSFNTHKGITTADFNSDGKKLVVTFLDSTAQIYDIEYGKLIYSIVCKDSKYGTPSITNALFSPDGKNILTIHSDLTARLWNASTGGFLHLFEGHTTNYLKGIFSPDSKNIITISNESARIWNVSSGNLLHTLNETSYIKNVCYSPDGKTIIITTDLINNGDIMIWDASEGKLLKILKAGSDLLINSAEFSPNGKNIIASTYDDKSRIWDAVTGELVHTFDGGRFAKYSPNGNYAITVSSNIRIYDTKTGNLLKILNYNKSLPSYLFDKAYFSSNNKKILVFSSIDPSYPALIFDLEKGIQTSFLQSSTSHFSFSKNINFSSDGKYMITTSSDGTIVWNNNTDNAIYIINQLRDNNWLTQLTKSPYYMSSKEGSKMIHYVSPNLKVISFEQLDVKYNRPDKVLESIGNQDELLIQSYRKAYEKRIKKLGIDTKAFRDDISVPEADFVNRELIDFEQKNENLRLQIKGKDTIDKLDRYNVWVNEVPVYGQRGISIKNLNLNELDTTITIKLSEGENRIETSITNINGIESYRMPLQIKYTPNQPIKEKLLFIGIGIDKFLDNRHNLKFCVKDIKDLAEKLKEKYGAAITIDTLFNENVTLNNVRNLKNNLLKTNENDKVIISYSGHGILSKDFDYFLSTHSVNFNDPTINGLPYDDLENLLDSIPARKKLMLIDACHSGEVDKDDLIRINSDTNTLLIKGSIPVAYKQNEKHLGLQSSFELMQSLFVNVSKSTGATIISASAGTQFAMEKNDLKNGVFTYSILEAMQQYDKLKISELKSIISKRVEELTKGLQKPSNRNETILVDWNVW
jgi:WD40 repeat protein